MTLPAEFRPLTAQATWKTLDIEAVWGTLDEVLSEVDPPTQIAIVGEVITRLAELFVDAAEQVFDELDATTAQDGPAMSLQQFLPYVRQSMEIDFTPFVGGFEREAARGPYAPRRAASEAFGAEQSLVAMVEPVTLAAAVAELEAAQSQALDLEAALELAHGEDVEAWSRKISAYFERTEVETVSLQTLQQSLDLPWIELWLGLLLGGYPLEQRGDDFYAAEIWIRNPRSTTLEREL